MSCSPLRWTFGYTAGAVLLAIGSVFPIRATEYRMEVDLAGEWAFEIGDSIRFAGPSFDDSKWERIRVPGAWENQGFPGYDGYAWYRTSFSLPEGWKQKTLVLKLGTVDDVDRVYVNGQLVGGEGYFPPDYETAWNVKRGYLLPAECLRFGKKNHIAVRVYDGQGAGGIVSEDVGIYSAARGVELKLNLSGAWKFAAGDKHEWALPETDDSKWKSVWVPMHWEKQGFRKYNGIAWYRKSVRIPEDLAKRRLVLLLGRINDRDQAFFNGVRIGDTGDFDDDGDDNDKDPDYKKQRAYSIPMEWVRAGDSNLIAVRVRDIGGNGGMYEGPVGVTTRDAYRKYQKGD